ncbi:MAG: cell surface protein SprA, partial [Bacteroidota bacterium]
YDPFNPDIRLKDYDITERKDKARLGQDFTERKSYNFTNVRKELRAGAKGNILSISNWSAGFSYSELLQRDFNIKYDRTKTWSGNLNYAYSFNTKPFEPFKNVKFMSKSKYWRIVQDMNLYLTPKNISFSNDATRMYNERQIRNNLVPDFEFAPVYAKQFFWNRKYAMGYDITKNLKATFDASNKALFDEANGRVDRKEDPEGYREFKDSIRTQMRTFGKTTDYSHNYNLTYNIPFDKIPVLDMVSGNIKYGGSYNWQRSPLGQSEFGNVMQNNRTVNVTGQVNMTNLYNKIPYLKRVNGGGAPARGRIDQRNPKSTAAPAEPKPVVIDTAGMTKREKRKYFRKLRREERKARQEKNKNKPVNQIAGLGLRMVMSLRNVSATYSQNDGTLLPGYANTANVRGFDNGYDNSLAGFVFGRQSYTVFGKKNGYDIATTSAERGWLVKNENLNKQHTISHNTNFSGRASLEPFKDLTIEMTVSRTYNINSNDFFRWNETDLRYEAQSKVEIATLTYTNITIGSAFTKFDSKTYSSATFDQMLKNLSEVSTVVGSKNTNSSLLSTGYYDGYGRSQQEVVLGAFLTAYSNKSVDSKNINPLSNMPLPNWTINYNGLSKFKFMKKYVRNFVIRHGYSSTTSISGIQTNLNATFDQNDLPTARDLNNNYVAQYQIQNVTMSERFSPLFGIDATWIIKSKGKDQGLLTKFEIKKDRSVTLSLNNNQVTEIVGKEYVIGSGYKFTQVKLPIKQVKASDVNLRFDFSFRDNLTVIRKVIENTNQATAGQRVVSIKFSADYNLGKNLTVMYYYDQVLNTPKIASSYPTGNLSTGIRLRFNLGGIQ